VNRAPHLKNRTRRWRRPQMVEVSATRASISLTSTYAGDENFNPMAFDGG
jgi:hypothetical protein